MQLVSEYILSGSRSLSTDTFQSEVLLIYFKIFCRLCQCLSGTELAHYRAAERRSGGPSHGVSPLYRVVWVLWFIIKESLGLDLKIHNTSSLLILDRDRRLYCLNKGSQSALQTALHIDPSILFWRLKTFAISPDERQNLEAYSKRL